MNLGRGESEVIALASETSIRAVIDDEKARKTAGRLGVKVTGTIGILFKRSDWGLSWMPMLK